MIISVDGFDAHASTGGVTLTGDDPVVLLIHGAGMDSTAWQQQTRYLAYRGFRAVAVDLPAHGRSAGEPLTSVESMADWVSRFVTAAGFGAVHVVGHSMGTFIALELASRYSSMVRTITLCGTATAMPVHPDLLDAAAHNLPAAAELMASWSHDKPAHVGLNPTPGLWMLGGARALVENSTPGVLSRDFGACVAYANATVAAAAVTCPATVVIGLGDKMTPPKAGRALAAALPLAHVIELAGTGHAMMTENPRAVKRAIITSVTQASINQAPITQAAVGD
jgi:pimeloyl-ACP methyl ester carboxylesterase